MAKVGADAVLVITPSYYKGGMTSEALTNHFVKVSVIMVFTFSVGLADECDIIIKS